MTKECNYYEKLKSASISKEKAKEIAAAVVARALDDYKDFPEERPEIERWILNGDVWLDIIFMDTSSDAILEGFRNYAKEKE